MNKGLKSNVQKKNKPKEKSLGLGAYPISHLVVSLTTLNDPYPLCLHLWLVPIGINLIILAGGYTVYTILKEANDNHSNK